MTPAQSLDHWYGRATAEQRRRGRRWYATAREMMAELAERTGYTVEQAVAVLAITSAGAQLSTNVRWTETALESRGAASVGRFPNAMRPKIAAVLASPEAAHEFVTGPKVSEFHRAILGDGSALVLDRWALAAALPNETDRDEIHGLTKGTRETVEQAYRALAKRTRMRVCDLQAVIWLAIRESTPVTRRGRTFIPRLADITTS